MKRKDEIINEVFDAMAKLYEEFASEHVLTLDKISTSSEIPKGKIAFGLNKLMEEGIVEKHTQYKPERYNMTITGYELWLSKEDAGTSSAPSDESGESFWQPLEIERPTEHAEDLDELAELLENDNGYKANHPEEATQTIFTLRGLSQSLKNTSKATKTAFIATKNALKRLAVVFNLADKTARISEIWTKVSEWLDKILSMLGL